MATNVRTVDFLPEIFQTPTNRQFLAATLDQLVQEPKFKKTQGFVGRKVGPGVNADDKYVIEPTKSRNDYQLEPGVIIQKPDSTTVEDAITYPGISDALQLQGAITSKSDRLYTSDYYSWDPFTDFDKLVNFSQYYWLPGGPLSVDVYASTLTFANTYDVTRANGVYTFSGVTGDNPIINLVRGGSYEFNVAQNSKETVNYRVTNNYSLNYVIDSQVNPALTLVRGNTYVFNLVLTGIYPFWIKTSPTTGRGETYDTGVSRNGSVEGLVTFVVPQDAPDTLYYISENQPNMQGQLNIVDGTPGTGPGFWIQATPGVNGRLPWAPNISSRDVLGVTNNGEDLGTVTFDVPSKDAQNFYYSLAWVGNQTSVYNVSLLTGLKFTQINNQFVDQFLVDNPTGIDGITSLNGKTVVFLNTTVDPVTGGWQTETQFDPLAQSSSNEGLIGSFDSVEFDQATDIPFDTRYSVWQIQYVTSPGGGVYMKLISVQSIDDLQKFNVQFGTEYSSTQWYKNNSGFIEEIPLLTAINNILYYQDGTDPGIFGQIKLVEPTNLTMLDIDDIIGHKQYTSPNGVVFTNGLNVKFTGEVYPLSYQNNEYYVEGVGTAIKLLPVVNYVTPELYTEDATIPFDSVGFDVGNYDADLNQPLTPDYITINRNSLDLNAWSRSNRWFHIDVINASAVYNNVTPAPDNKFRAKRPILEFRGNLKLFESGTEAKTPINVIDFKATDAFSTINGTTGYGVDGYNFIQGTQVIFAADSDPQVRNKIYNVDFISPNLVTEVLGSIGPLESIFTGDGSTTTYILTYSGYFSVNVFVDSVLQTIGVDYTLSGTTLEFIAPPANGASIVAKENYTNSNSFLASSTKGMAINMPITFTGASGVGGITLGTEYYINSIIDSTHFKISETPDGSALPLTTDSNIMTGLSQVTPIINLVLAEDGIALVDQSVVCLNGITLQGKSFYFDGVDWLPAQQKSGVNQPPLFDIYDAAGISLSNKAKYFSSTFAGCKLFSYAVGSGLDDTILGFPLQYFSLSNLGDIVFENSLYNNTFIYVENNISSTANVSIGFVRQYLTRLAYQREIGWQPAVTPSLTRQQFQFTYDGTPLALDIKVIENNVVPAIVMYIGSEFQSPDSYTVTTTSNTTKIVLNKVYVPGSVIEIDVLSDQASTNGFYQVPINLENNPFNVNSGIFTLGTVRSHYETIGENLLALQGPINGANNSRDLGNIVPYGLQILQQSSPLTLAGFFMRDQEYDIFKSLAFNDREYTKFKNRLLETVANNDWGNSTISQILDSSVTELSTGKTETNSFYWSDMLPAGSISTSNSYTITPITTHTFDTIQTYDFSTANYLGLLVYLDDRLLTINVEYVVATDGPRVTILIPLPVGSVVTIREFSNTTGNFVPNTPTKVGLYPAFKPRIFFDTNYVNPTLVIQGHDGSITVAFGDIRDSVLLEFELRIYNNLKLKDNPVPLTIADVLPGYFRKTDYSASEITGILAESFLTWVGWNKLDYKEQTYDANDPFTYNYSQAGDKLKNEPLLGAWRGISRYFYDTLSPNYTPWEMVGFSEKPDWWETQYGPAPYTSDNLVLWDDMAAGLVADPAGNYILPQYIRQNLQYFIPNGSSGELLAPLESVVGQYNPNVWRKSWVVGDGGPVEASWWESSSYPFAVMRLLALTRPAEFFALFADRDVYKYDSELDQYLYNQRYRLDASGVQVYGNGVSKASYINWIVDYNQQLGRNSTTALEDSLASLDVRLCYRMASFTDKQYLKVYTERSSPNSLNSSLLLPDESYRLPLYKNTPFAYVTYSAIIVQVVDNGYTVFGYSTTDPYFAIYASRSNGQLQTVDTGGSVVRVPKQYYENIVQVPYGFTFANQTAVVDFILSYGELLKTQGLTFIDRENGYTLDWMQMAKEFLYWANQGWQSGSIINLNPSAGRLIASKPGSVVDDISASNPENLIIDQNRLPIDARNLVIERLDNSFSITSTTSSAIAYIKLKFTSYEHMVILDNLSIFNDLLYDPATGARQNRINIVAYTSTEWNGTLNAQGFILNEDNIKEWRANLRYPKGEIVLYKNTYWSAQTIVQPKVEFDYNDWVKSDWTKIQRGLLPNIANKADQLANSYNIQTANLEGDNDLLSYGLIGFRPRQYMAALNLDDVSQVNLYKNFLGSKGTIKSAEIFTGANLGKEVAQYDIYENWAVQRGTYGANANRSFFELRLNEALLQSDPATIQVTIPGETSLANQTILLSDLWRQSYKITSPNILPTTYTQVTDTALPSAGYVNIDDVDITVFSIDDPTNISANLDTIGIGTKIWVAKTNNYDWNIYRANKVPGYISLVSDNLNGTSQVTFTQAHGLTRGSLLIIRFFNSAINGVYRVLNINGSPNTLTIAYDFGTSRQTSIIGQGVGFFLQTMRVSQASDIVNLPYATELVSGAMAWVDNDGNGNWEVLEKQKPFTLSDQLLTATVSENTNFGYSVAQAYNNVGAIVGAPGYDSGAGAVYGYNGNKSINYIESEILKINAVDVAGYGNSVDFGHQTWAVAGASASNSNKGYATPILYAQISNSFLATQLLIPPDVAAGSLFGESVAISEDERWMYIGAPGNNTVYAYGIVNVENQAVFYTTDGSANYNYSDSIEIDPAAGEQLVVTLADVVQIYGVDYTIDTTDVIFTVDPVKDQSLTIARRTSLGVLGDGSTVDFDVQPFLYTIVANNIYSFTVTINGVTQRLNIDYTFAGYIITFNTAPVSNAAIVVSTATYWEYITDLTVSGLPGDAKFGASVKTSTDGRQIIIGAPRDTENGVIAGATYVFDRSISRQLIADATQTVYAIPTGYQSPIAVLLNNQYLTNTADYPFTGQFTVNGSTITLASSVTTEIGDTLDIETNVFQQVQRFVANEVFDEAEFGYAVDLCPYNCSLYIGAPYDGSVLDQAGSVNRQVNQARLYGVITSTIANPSLTVGDTFRINDYVISVPTNNTVAGLVNTINSVSTLSVGTVSGDGSTAIVTFESQTLTPYVNGQLITISGCTQNGFNGSFIVTGCTTTSVSFANTTSLSPAVSAGGTITTATLPNVVATATRNLLLNSDGATQVFDVGTIYSAAASYTTVVYVGETLQTNGVDYNYNNTTEQITFTTAPASNEIITVVSGRITISVKNADAAAPTNKLTVLPGVLPGTTTPSPLFNDLGFEAYVYTQTITSPAPLAYAQFGTAVSVDTTASTLVVGTPYGNLYEPTTFDGTKTYFDEHSTTFFNLVVNSGVVYSYDYLPSANDSVTNPGKFVFGQQIYDTSVEPLDRFGTSVNYITGKLLVGAPGNDPDIEPVNYGGALVFTNTTNTPAWTVKHIQQPVVDVALLNSVFMYNKLLSTVSSYLDFFNPLQGKILGIARQDIDYIGAVDPANYNNGSVHNVGNPWDGLHVGEIWWDTNLVRFIDPNQDDIVYASRRWGQVFPGSRIDIYQWVESPVPPVSYAGPGTPLSTISYTTRAEVTLNGIISTVYYFWVRNISTVNTVVGKKLSTTAIASYIENPRASGIAYLAPLNASTVAIYNVLDLISAQDTILHIEYDREANDDNVHVEYELIAQDKADSFLSGTLYLKLQDSFCGANESGAAVPDPTLSPAEKYGVQFRPRQSMFGDRFVALQNYLVHANNVLKNYPISETRKFNLLNSSEPEPNSSSGAWNKRVADLTELNYQNLATVPVGYKYLVSTDSTNNGLWTIYEVTYVPGSSVKTLTLIRVQNYDTTRYWSYINWYLPGYNSTLNPVAEVPVYSSLATLSVPVGASVKVTANAQGKFEIYQRNLIGWDRVGLQDGTIAFSEVLWDYAVGRFGFDVEVFDAQYFDQSPVIETRKIIQAINQELFVDDLLLERNRALTLVFNFVLSEFTAPEWLIKTSLIDVNHRIRDLIPYQIYRQDNQDFVLNYIQEVKPYHVQVREFSLTYNGFDRYPGAMTDFDVPAYYNTDLVIPQYVSPILLPYDKSTATGYGAPNSISDTPASSLLWTTTPWNEWYNNYLLSVNDTEIVYGGTEYTEAPIVTVVGDCVVPATMTAIISSSGQVVNLIITNPGSGYSATPTITFTGGNGTLGEVARAYPIMGNDLVRSIKTIIKYDRYQYHSTIVNWAADVSYPAGTQVRYIDKVWQATSTITATPVITTATCVPLQTYVTVASTYGLSTGMLMQADGITENSFIVKIQGNNVYINQLTITALTADPVSFYLPFNPAQWTRVDASTLSGVNRTMGLYLPGPNEPGIDLPLLIDGVDYPGVQVKAFDFSVKPGFDSTPFDAFPFDNLSYGPDGSPTYDVGLLDAIYESSYNDIYLGTRPTDINVDGGAYVDTYSSYAPEELVPGAEFDTLDIRVYTTPGADWARDGHGFRTNIKKYVAESTTPIIDFSNIVPYVAVISVTNQTTGLELAANSTVIWADKLVEITSGVSINDVIVITAYEVGGGNQLFKQSYNGDDVGSSVVIPVQYSLIQEFAIFVNGNYITSSNYSYVALGTSKTTLSFNTPLTITDYVLITAIGTTTIDNTSVNYSWSTPQTTYIVATGSLTYTITNSMIYSNQDDAVISINGRRLKSSAGIPHIANGSTTTYALPTRLGFSQALIANTEVRVYVNDVQKTLFVDYNLGAYDGINPRNIVFVSAPGVTAKITIYVTTNSQAYISSGILQFNPAGGFVPIAGDIISVTSWNDTRQQDILTQVFVGPVAGTVIVTEPYDSTDFDSATTVDPDVPGSFDYTFGATVPLNNLLLDQVVINPDRLIVTLNGYRLFPNSDFTLVGNEIVLASGVLSNSDVVIVTEFTNSIAPEAMAFRIFQDMRGVQATYRITPATTTFLTEPLLATSDVIYVDDASLLSMPVLENGIWGVITIAGERIMYRVRNTVTNTISSLLRGTAGTGAADHLVDELVYDIGRGNLMSVEDQNYIVQNSTMGDGSTTTFTAEDINVSDLTEAQQTEAVEVFVGGIRVEYDTDYSLDSVNPVSITLIIPPPSTVEVTILVKRGVTWYQQGISTASDGVALQDTNTAAARFLKGL